MKRKLFSAGAVALMMLSTSAWAKSIADLPKEEREKITTRTFEKDYDTVFKAVMTAFEDKGTPAINTDKTTGLIVSDYKGANMGTALLRWSASVEKIDDTHTKVKLNPAIQTVTSDGGTVSGTFTTRFKKHYDEYFKAIEENLK
jgi:hypothetical protein